MNRLPNVREIATKGRLAFHISKHMARLNQPPDFIPETHVVSAKLQFGKEKDRLQEASSRNQKEGFGTVWIAKPDNRNRGRDISVHKSMGKLQDSGGTRVMCMAGCDSVVRANGHETVCCRLCTGAYQHKRLNGVNVGTSKVHRKTSLSQWEKV